ncbi:hypothetical protein [Peribacillus muralis]|uniref:hypothetical protein n=1 Tax=Peribacillus muralis TaxID=264697 RepID=UPI00366A9CEC
MSKFLNRIKNPKVITAIVSAFLLIAVNTGVIDLEMSTKIDIAIDSVLAALIGIGVFGNPESHVKE